MLWDMEGGESQGLELWFKRVRWKRSAKDIHKLQLLTSFIGACLQATFETHIWGEAVLKLMSDT